LCGNRQALGHHLPIPVDVTSWREDNRDRRQRLDRGGAQRLHAGDTIDGVLDRLGDKDLDLLGGKPGRLGLDADLGRCELRKHVVFRADDREDAVAEQQQGQGHDDAAEADGEADDIRLQARLR